MMGDGGWGEIIKEEEMERKKTKTELGEVTGCRQRYLGTCEGPNPGVSGKDVCKAAQFPRQGLITGLR